MLDWLFPRDSFCPPEESDDDYDAFMLDTSEKREGAIPRRVRHFVRFYGVGEGFTGQTEP